MTENEKLDLILEKLGKLDRIEERLEKVEERLEKVEERLEKVEERLDRLEGSVDELRERVDKLDSDIMVVKLTLENEIRTNIMRVAEGHQDLYRKLREATKTDDEKEMIAIRVNMMEAELRTIKERLEQIA